MLFAFDQGMVNWAAYLFTGDDRARPFEQQNEKPEGLVLERFVGALAVVFYRFQVWRKHVAAAAAFREVMNVVAQSDGMNPWSPCVREVRLVKRDRTDIQAFGYDESSVPEPDF